MITTKTNPYSQQTIDVFAFIKKQLSPMYYGLLLGEGIQQMEKQSDLLHLDKELCNYHLRNNYGKRDNLFCYKPSKKQISQFYNSMNEHFYQKHFKNGQDSHRNLRNQKIKSQIEEKIKNPLNSCLPKSITQNNLIDTSKVQIIQMSTTPMFSEVQTKKKQKYIIAKEVRDILTCDIKHMQVQKEQALFRRRFPHREPIQPAKKIMENTQNLIKHFNRLLLKYKSSNYSVDMTINLLQKQNLFEALSQGANDQRFKILNIFRKLYLETKSEDINEALLKYLSKFEAPDKFTKKTNNSTKLIKHHRKEDLFGFFTAPSTPKSKTNQSSLKNSRQKKIVNKNEGKTQNLRRTSAKSHFFKERQIELKGRNNLQQISKIQFKSKIRSQTSHQYFKNNPKLRL